MCSQDYRNPVSITKRGFLICVLALAEQKGLLVILGEKLVEASVLAGLQHAPEQVASQSRAPEGDGPWCMQTWSQVPDSVQDIANKLRQYNACSAACCH